MTSGRERFLRGKRDRLRASQTPLVSTEQLDAFALGWTPDQVRALVASYRQLLAHRTRSLELARLWQANDSADVRMRGLELECEVLAATVQREDL